MENKGNLHTERTTVITKDGNKTVINTVSERDYNGKNNTYRARGVGKTIKGVAGVGSGIGKTIAGAGVGLVSSIFTVLLIVLIIRFLNGQSLPTAEGFLNWLGAFDWEGIPYIAFNWQTDISSSNVGLGILQSVWGVLSKVIDSVVFLFNLLWSVLGSIASFLAWIFFA